MRCFGVFVIIVLSVRAAPAYNKLCTQYPHFTRLNIVLSCYLLSICCSFLSLCRTGLVRYLHLHIFTAVIADCVFSAFIHKVSVQLFSCPETIKENEPFWLTLVYFSRNVINIHCPCQLKRWNKIKQWNRKRIRLNITMTLSYRFNLIVSSPCCSRWVFGWVILTFHRFC